MTEHKTKLFLQWKFQFSSFPLIIQFFSVLSWSLQYKSHCCLLCSVIPVSCSACDDDTVVVFAARSPEVSPDLQQMFTKFSLETGINSDNIVILPKNGKPRKRHTKIDTHAFIYHRLCFSTGKVLGSLASSWLLLQLSVPKPEVLLLSSSVLQLSLWGLSLSSPNGCFSPSLGLLCSIPKLHLRKWSLTQLFLSNSCCLLHQRPILILIQPCVSPALALTVALEWQNIGLIAGQRERLGIDETVTIPHTPPNAARDGLNWHTGRAYPALPTSDWLVIIAFGWG